MEEVGYGIRALEPPWWPDARWYHYEEEWDAVRAPILYTRREEAEEEARSLRHEEPEGYLELVEDRGQADADEAMDNYVPYKALWVDRETLVDKLEGSRFLCLKVDGVLRLRRDLLKELRGDENEEV